MRYRKAYYTVFGLKDGTIWFAIQKRKPYAGPSGSRVRIDQDGIFEWYAESVEEESSFTGTAKIVRGATLATCLNLRRTIREMVEHRLEKLERRLQAIEDRLAELVERLPAAVQR